MNSMERLQNLLAGQPLDRRPFTLLLSLYGAVLTGCPLERHYSEPAAYVRGQTAVREVFRPDVLFAPVAVAALAEAFGARVQYSAEVAPVVVAPAVRSAAEWASLPSPDPDRHPRLLYLREALRLLAAEHGREVPIAAVLLAPFDLASLVIGIDEWMGTLLFDRPTAEMIVRRLTPFVVDMANRCFEGGATFVVLSVMYASPGFVTRDIATRFSRPALAEVLAQLRGPVVLHHVEHPLLPHLDALAGLPGVAGIALAEGDDLNRAREILGPGPILLDGPAAPWLRNASRTEVEAVCRTFLEDRRDDPRFILATSKTDVYYDTPAENIHALREAVEAFAGESA